MLDINNINYLVYNFEKVQIMPSKILSSSESFGDVTGLKNNYFNAIKVFNLKQK
jgi:hypothetical protein